MTPRMMRSNLVDFIVIGVAVTIVLISTNWRAIMATVTPPPVVYRNLPFPVRNSPIQAGEPLALHIDQCYYDGTRDRPLKLTASRLLYRPSDSYLVTIPAIVVSVTSQGCRTSDVFLDTIPVGLSPGRYILVGETTAEGRWKTTTAAWQTEEVEVIAR